MFTALTFYMWLIIKCVDVLTVMKEDVIKEYVSLHVIFRGGKCLFFVLADIGSQTMEPEKAHDLPSEIWEASDGSDEL